MNAPDTEMATASGPFVPHAVVERRSTVIGLSVASAIALNVLIYLVGRALGGGFTYSQAGKPIRVDAVAVALMSAAPLAIGLTLVAWLSGRWPTLLSTAKTVAPILAIVTIFVMTVPARFDTTTTFCLAAMHLALAPTSVLALEALARRR